MMATQATQKARNPLHPAILRIKDGDAFFEQIRELSDTLKRRAYELFEDRGRHHGHDLQDWLEAEAALLKAMPLEINEADGELIVRADVPGFHDKDIEVRVQPRQLIISGKRATNLGRLGQKTLYSERMSDEIFRMVDLGEEIDPDRVQASLEHGILEVMLPKANHGNKSAIAARAA